MTALRRIVDGVVDFVIGDDWRLALGVLVVLVIAGVVGHVVASWWIVVVGVTGMLWFSLRRAVRAEH